MGNAELVFQQHDMTMQATRVSEEKQTWCVENGKRSSLSVCVFNHIHLGIVAVPFWFCIAVIYKVLTLEDIKHQGCYLICYVHYRKDNVSIKIIT